MTAIITTSPSIANRQATWEDYLHRVENPQSELERVFFNCGSLWVEDIGNESINHARTNKLMTMILANWFVKQEKSKFDLLGGCGIEKPPYQAAAPDEMLYISDNFPQERSGESPRINLNQCRVPDLVVEISDTTLSTDLDRKKQLYLALEIPEYWVVNIRGKQVIAFRLIDGEYEECTESIALSGLPIQLLEQTIDQMDNHNGNAALWFAAQIQNLPAKSVE
jgi:Uma2 family endonuclease